MTSRNVITGLGIVSSIGIGREAFWDGLINKRSGIRSLADRNDEGAKPGVVSDPPGLWIGGPILDFEPKQFVRPRKALKVMCREIQTAFAASDLAITDANLSSVFPLKPASEPASKPGAHRDWEAEGSGNLDIAITPADVGTVFGGEMYYGPPSEMRDAFEASMDEEGNFDPAAFGNAAMKNVMPLWMLKYLPNMPACHVGIALGAHGPNNSLVLGDVSGPSAVMEAASCLDRGIAKLMLAGVSGTRINTTRLNYRADLPIPTVTDPTELSSRPHDPSSAGVVGGEAAVTLVVEPHEQARSRGVKPLAEIRSMASRFFASDSIRAEERSVESKQDAGRGSAAAIESAINAVLNESGFAAKDIGAIVSQGSGDPSMDYQEAMALRKCLSGTPVVAPTASLGHTGAAVGSINLAVGALIIANGQIPATVQADDKNKSVPLLATPQSLGSDTVICLSHTSEGGAVATLLSVA